MGAFVPKREKSMIIQRYEPVATLANGETVSWRRFVSDVFAVYLTLDEEAGRVAVFSKDTYAFMVSAVAVLKANKTMVVLPNDLNTTLEKYCSSYDVYIDTGDDKLALLQPVDCPEVDLLEISVDANVVFYTSGSSGQPAEVEKTLKQLCAEVNDTSLQLGLNQQKKVVSTVPHQHLYGFLFKVVASLINGLTMVSAIARYPSQMRAESDYVLVSSPAFLSRLEADEVIEGATLVLSSGGPLSYETGKKCQAVFGCDGYEIYGSTETGGIAFRAFSSERHFTPFRGVEISANEESTLQIRSQYVDPHRWITTSDRVNQRDDGSFSLLGRIDDIVKIEEKRTSLTEIANLINSHYSWINKSYVVTYESSRRIKLAALIVSHAKLTEYDKSRLIENLTREMRNYIDPVFVPRTWKIVDRIEENEVGKVTRETILSKIFLDHLEEEVVSEAV